MILAAGLGERMRPLTDHTPKPLLPVGGKPLLQWHLENLARAGIADIVINVSHLAGQIRAFVGDGSRWNCRVEWSPEAEPLETAGGIIQALPLLGNEPFALVNADVWSDYPLDCLQAPLLQPGRLAHLVLVDNPPQHPGGDFLLAAAGRIAQRASGESDSLTYAGIGLYHPRMFAGASPGKQPLLPFLERAIAADQLGGEHYIGDWTDVGTPERLRELDARLGLL
jgi:MurNAc alpha-1-phosphate uridylyltransferase